MNTEVSAFLMYKQQNKKKRKAPLEHKMQPKSSAPLKKKKKFVQQALNQIDKPTVTKKPKKTVIKKVKKINVSENIKLGTGDISSDEEIPQLVSINGIEEDTQLSDKNLLEQESVKTNGKTKRLKKQTLQSVDSDSNALDVSIFNPLAQSLVIFKWLIYPITPQNFFEKYWEKDILFIDRSDSKYFEEVFSTEKLDSILREYPLHFNRNVDVVAYQNGKKEVMEEEGRALPIKLWDYYNNGCSVRILNPQTYDQNIHSIIASLQEYFGTMVGTNVYLTPPNSQGFAPHFDDIEAFIVQLEGSKYWKLYKPKPEDVLARDSSPNFNASQLGPPFVEVKLNAGDMLYFPRGTIHEGHTKEEHSLHITISVYQHTAYVDLLEQALPAALKKAATDNVEFRKGLPINYLKHVGVVNKNEKSKMRKMLLNHVKSLAESLINYLDLDNAADNLGRKFMHDAMPPIYSQEEAVNSCKHGGDYMENGIVLNRVALNPEIRVRLLRYYALRVVQESESTSRIYYCTDNGKSYHGEEEQWLEIDNSMIPGVEMLQKQYPNFVEADMLPIEDETEKLSLVSELWEHGLLVTDGPLPLCDDDDDDEGDSDD